MTTVVIERCNDYDPQRVEAAVGKMVDELGGIKKFVKPSQKVLIKPNLLVGKPVEKAVCTHPRLVYAVGKMVKEAGGRPFIGDSPSFGTARSVCKKCGIMPVAEELDIEVVNFKETVELANPHSLRYRTVTLAREATEADVVINLPRIKTHALMLMTMAVKNMFGCVVGMQKTQWHLRSAHQIEAFAEMLLSVYRLVGPALTIVDGIVAMQGNGPGSGTPRPLGILMAGTDAVALDRVIGEIVGLKSKYNLTANLGHELNMGNGDLESIRIKGPALEDISVKDFKFPHSGPPKDQKIPWPLNRIIGDASVTIPEIEQEKCSGCATCINTCPAEAMEKLARGDKEFIKINRSRCIHCLCCQEVCPEDAITPHTGWLARLLS